ncbi:MAG: Uma2 family endonuclease [Byssovorax sp.]
MGSAALRAGLSEQEYLAFERSSPEKHEYADGEIFATSGGTAEHSAISLNLMAEIRSAISGRKCRPFESNMRIHIPATGRYVYPDGSIVCGRPVFTDDTRDTLRNPRVIVEVLSDSTEAYDRGDKFANYRTVPSFEEYVIASQKQPLIEVLARESNGSWNLRLYGPGERAEIRSLACTVEVDRVYAGVFDPVEEEDR